MPKIATRQEFDAARIELLADEKAHSRRSDELARKRRELPWVRIEHEYSFETEAGQRTLADLFDGRSQLAVYHFMFGDGWGEGCPSCSFWADNYNGTQQHLAARDVTLTAVSSAPLAQLLAYRERMGWSFPWASSGGSTFNRDFEVAESDRYNYQPVDEPIGERHGMSMFALLDGEVYHTYSTYGRGVDIFNGAYQLLDAAPHGRNEDDLPFTMAWLRRRDSY